MKLYTCSAIAELLETYSTHEGYDVATIDEGVLGYGTMVVSACDCKYCVIQEVYINPWSSAHKVRFYNELPKKWQKLVDDANSSFDE